ncbi:TPA: hypothetical protein ACOAY7_002776 [Vibrio cholerae]|nr:putative baseplate assembly protein [Vibrio phage ICP1]QVV97703.1 putative baseplate assembly protein [Vibrio phage ICP1]QVV97930.1 putative baseplate assembly protein [Vibrio phage ICP1]QVV98157.1 putative baseplate assembly protein [Vibrio phage ICP1]QVV98383.1 putative baseplate assembly protein [Vibrio phage ICP1]
MNFSFLDMSLTEGYTEEYKKRYLEWKDGIPARITSTRDYETEQCVAVEFMIKDIYTWKGGEDLRAVKLNKVFVRLPKFGPWVVKLPCSVDDLVILHFSSKDLNQFLAGNGEQVTQKAAEIGELEDCYAELGFGTRKSNNQPSLENLIITNGAFTMTVTPQGDYTIITSGTGTYQAQKHTFKNDVEIEGNLTVKQNTTVDGTVTSKAGMFSPTYSGYGGAGSMTIGTITAQTSVTIDGIEVLGHNHTNPEGGDVGPMK